MRTSLVLAASFFLATSAFARGDVEHAFQSAIQRGQVQRVLIAIPYGSFTIRNGSSRQIAVSGIVSRDYDDPRERAWAQRVVDDSSVEIHVRGTEAVVRRKFGKNAQSWRAKRFSDLDLRLELPPGIDIRFDGSAGEVDVAGNFGDVSITLGAGEIDVRVPRASVRELNASCRIGEVRTNLGSEIVTREGILPGRTHFFNAEGKAHVNVHVTVGEVDVTLER